MSKKSRFREEQIIRALKEVDAGAKVDEVCRRLGVTLLPAQALRGR